MDRYGVWSARLDHCWEGFSLTDTFGYLEAMPGMNKCRVFFCQIWNARIGLRAWDIKQKPHPLWDGVLNEYGTYLLSRLLADSTIGHEGLNFSVRDGKR